MTVDELIEKLEPYRGFTISALYYGFPNVMDCTLSIGDASYSAKELTIDVGKVEETE